MTSRAFPWSAWPPGVRFLIGVLGVARQAAAAAADLERTRRQAGEVFAEAADRVRELAAHLAAPPPPPLERVGVLFAAAAPAPDPWANGSTPYLPDWHGPLNPNRKAPTVRDPRYVTPEETAEATRAVELLEQIDQLARRGVFGPTPGVVVPNRADRRAAARARRAASRRNAR